MGRRGCQRENGRLAGEEKEKVDDWWGVTPRPLGSAPHQTHLGLLRVGGGERDPGAPESPETRGHHGPVPSGPCSVDSSCPSTLPFSILAPGQCVSSPPPPPHC